MYRIVLRGMAAHKRRLIGTCSAVILGIAFLTGTLVLGDTMTATFSTAFATLNANTDAVIQSDTQLGEDASAQSGTVPDSLLPKVAATEGVLAVAPVVQGTGQIVGSDGKPIGGDGPPTIAENWIDGSISGSKIITGRAPQGSNEVLINSSAATTGNLHVGSKTIVRTPNNVAVTIVGIAQFGALDTGSGPTFTAFSLADAQRYLGTPGQLSQILVQADQGISQQQLVDSLKPLMPVGVTVITGDQFTADLNTYIQEGFLSFFQTFLLVFAGVALVVATFSIYNTFAVIVAQRTRESALLRALGASRGQVLRSTSVEALLIGLLASAVGIGVGVLLGWGLLAGFVALGVGLPADGLVISGSTILAGLIVGVLVTLAASLAPAIRASRVAPLAALRDLAIDRSGASRARAVTGVSMLVVGTGLLASTWFAPGESALARCGLGSLICFVSFIALGPIAAGPVGKLLGAPIAILRGTSGRMARANAVRNPKRTASTAAALMIGICIVSMFTVFAASIKSTIDATVAGTFTGDLVISSKSFSGAGFSQELAVKINQLPQVADAAGIAPGSVLLKSAQGGTEERVSVTDPTRLSAVLNVDVTQGSLTSVGPDQIAVGRDTATANGLKAGDQVTLGFADRTTAKPTIAAIYNSQELIRDLIVPTALWKTHVSQIGDTEVLIALADGTSIEAGKAAIQPLADEFSAGTVQDKQEFIAEQSGQIDQLLNIIYVLLVLAIIIALMGISNTLALSLYERTHELGLLRAVGQTRSQTRSMVRWESVIIAVFGTVGGLGLGALLGWGLVTAIRSNNPITTFSLPITQLLIVAIVGALAGVLAGLRPAARAAKLNVLDAIATT